MGNLWVGNPLAEVDRVHLRTGQGGNRGGRDHQIVHGEEDSHRLGHVLEANGSVRGHHRSIHDEVGSGRGSHHGGGYIHGMGHGGHSHPDEVDDHLGSVIGLGRGGCPVECLPRSVQ